jgi:PAS domain S-box-containing protein
VNGANDGIWEWIPSTGEDYLSPRWKQLLGYEDHELPNVQASFFDQIHPEDKPRVLEVVRAHFEERKPYEIELRFRCKNGEYRWFYSRGQAVWDKHGQPLRMAGSITDITERKRAEEEREKLIRDLQKALAEVKTLKGIFPICASCKKIRDDKGYWRQIEAYIRDHSEAEFSHGICPDCMKKLYGDFLKEEDTSRTQ